MSEITIIKGDAKDHAITCDLIFTDPPYELSGFELSNILSNFKSDHLVMLTTMTQLIDFLKVSDFTVNFDFVFDCVIPKKSRNYQTPHYTHQNGVYCTRNKAKSLFNRKLRSRSDVHAHTHFFSTIFNAPRNTNSSHHHQKNQEAITDLLGCFLIKTVCDPFAGGGTTAIASIELDLNCALIEKDESCFKMLKSLSSFAVNHKITIIE